MADCKTKVLKGKAEWRSLAFHILRLFIKKKKKALHVLLCDCEDGCFQPKMYSTCRASTALARD